MSDIEYKDVIVIGAGAAGMMCAWQAAKRGRSVAIIEHMGKIGEKIRISGGGRCNFTNLYCSPANFLSQNPHFCKSALAQFTRHDFIRMIERAGIAYHEKTLGQLFCDESAQQVIDMLRQGCEEAGVVIALETAVRSVRHEGGLYHVNAGGDVKTCSSLVIASGGLSIPKIGATPFGYEIARQFGLEIVPTRPGLVPLTFQGEVLEFCKGLAGVSVDAVVSVGKTRFREGLLFTHRGLSGPSILQISSYWREGEAITVDLSPDTPALPMLKEKKASSGKTEIQNVLSDLLPRRLALGLCELHGVSGRLADLKGETLEKLAKAVNHWQVWPAGTEGYRTAEVTLGGVSTAELSSQTMEARRQPGLYFIGEVVDVTGHLGGFNFQWAWSSGYAAGQNV